MPGVPTGRGCDACRKQKKKCIFDEANPVCSRCARLGIECIGRGTKRYIFKAEYNSASTSTSTETSKRQDSQNPSQKSNARASQESSSLSISSSSSSSVSSPYYTANEDNDNLDLNLTILIERTPSNATAALTQALLSTMGPQIDLRYNLFWAYGGFIRMVPCRLGINKALDATVDALVTAHLAISCGNEVGVNSMVKYSKALGALRVCLDDPVEACMSETLCAVCLLLIVQGMHDSLQHKWTGHGEGAAKILKARKHIAPRNEFEARLLLSLRGPILFEALFNPNIDFTPTEWKDLVESDLDSIVPQEGKLLYCLSRVPTILNRARDLNIDPESKAKIKDKRTETGLQSIQIELEGLYTTTRAICDEFRSRLLEVEVPGALYSTAALAALKMDPTMLHAHYQRMYVFAITINLYINYILAAMYTDIGVESEPGMKSVAALKLDAVYLANEMLQISENAIMYRPFGAAIVPWGLLAARMAVGLGLGDGFRSIDEDVILMEALEREYWDYQSDFNGVGHDMERLGDTFGRLRPFGLEARLL